MSHSSPSSSSSSSSPPPSPFRSSLRPSLPGVTVGGMRLFNPDWEDSSSDEASSEELVPRTPRSTIPLTKRVAPNAPRAKRKRPMRLLKVSDIPPIKYPEDTELPSFDELVELHGLHPITLPRPNPVLKRSDGTAGASGSFEGLLYGEAEERKNKRQRKLQKKTGRKSSEQTTSSRGDLEADNELARSTSTSQTAELGLSDHLDMYSGEPIAVVHPMNEHLVETVLLQKVVVRNPTTHKTPTVFVTSSKENAQVIRSTCYMYGQRLRLVSVTRSTAAQDIMDCRARLASETNTHADVFLVSPDDLAIMQLVFGDIECQPTFITDHTIVDRMLLGNFTSSDTIRESSSDIVHVHDRPNLEKFVQELLCILALLMPAGEIAYILGQPCRNFPFLNQELIKEARKVARGMDDGALMSIFSSLTNRHFFYYHDAWSGSKFYTRHFRSFQQHDWPGALAPWAFTSH